MHAPSQSLQYSQPIRHSCSLASLNSTDKGSNHFQKAPLNWSFFLLGCTGVLAPWGLLSGCQHYLHPLPSGCLPEVVVGLWDGKWGLGLHTHLLVVCSASLQRLALPTCMRRTLLLLHKSHDAGCGRAMAVDPGNTHQEQRRLSMLNSPGRRVGWAVTVQEAARALVTPRCSLAWSSPPRKSEWTKEPRGNHENGGWPGLPSSLPGPATGECAGQGADRSCAQLEIPLRLERRGAPWPPPPPPRAPSSLPGSNQLSSALIPGQRLRHTPALNSPGGGPMSLGVW